jgi:putative transposase
LCTANAILNSWIPKCRKKQLYGCVAKYSGSIFHQLARERENRIVEGHLCPDYEHPLIEIPPKYSAAPVAGYIKGRAR